MDITRRLYEEEAKKAQQEAWEHSLVEQRDPIRGFTVCHAILASDCMHYIGMSHVIHMSLLINLSYGTEKNHTYLIPDLEFAFGKPESLEYKVHSAKLRLFTGTAAEDRGKTQKV